MTGDPTHPEGCTGHDAPSIGALIRAAADAELTPEQVARFERLCAERDCTQDRVRFEQTLRDCCARVMTTPRCSDALRAKVAALAAQARAEDDAPASHPASASPQGSDQPSGPLAMAPATRTRAFWQRSPLLAAAATLLLSVAGVMIWQTARTTPVPPVPGMTMQQVAYRDRIAGFVAEEHQRACRSDPASEAKLVHRDIESARTHYAQAFGVTQVSLAQPQADAGQVRFWGGGDCHIPGTTRSAHLRYDAVNPDGEPLRLSVFIMPDNNRLPMQEGTTYRVNASSCDQAGVALYAWRRDGLLYLLVSEAKGEFCGQVRRALDAPTQTAGL